MVLTELYAPMPALQGVVLLLNVAVLVAAVKIGTRLGWWRALGALAVFVPLSAGLGLAAASLVRATLFTTYVMAAGSMQPTLVQGDRFLVDRTASPDRWDIVAFTAPIPARITWAMRVIGLPGEVVEVRNGRIFINGEPAEVPTELREIRYENPPRFFRTRNDAADPALTLGPTEYFVLGDNSAEALDSRVWGPAPDHRPAALPSANIIGVARLIYAPAERVRMLD
jgi:signal peptidase I